MPLLWESEISQLVFLSKEALDVFLVTNMALVHAVLHNIRNIRKAEPTLEDALSTLVVIHHSAFH